MPSTITLFDTKEHHIHGHPIKDFEVLASRFDKSWGIAALIGLDFFRRFHVAVNYAKGEIVTEPLP